MMKLHSFVHSVRDAGFAIAPNIFDSRETTRVLEALERRSPTRSRAGIRHALKYPEVTELA
jgi:hypothetical protein